MPKYKDLIDRIDIYAAKLNITSPQYFSMDEDEPAKPASGPLLKAPPSKPNYSSLIESMGKRIIDRGFHLQHLMLQRSKEFANLNKYYADLAYKMASHIKNSIDMVERAQDWMINKSRVMPEIVAPIALRINHLTELIDGDKIKAYWPHAISKDLDIFTSDLRLFVQTLEAKITLPGDSEFD